MPLIRPTNICTTLIHRLFKNNLDKVFIHYRLIVQTAAASSQSEREEVESEDMGGQEEQLVSGETSTAELQR